VKIDEAPDFNPPDPNLAYFGYIENGVLNVWERSKEEPYPDSNFQRVIFMKSGYILKNLFKPSHQIQFKSVDDKNYSYKLNPKSKIHSKWFISLNDAMILVSMSPIDLQCECHKSIEELQFEMMLYL
jgi:hypothetical protein